jgi:hypothetical protein
MKHQGGSSILKSLAVAFGDGLAFGVGMKIAQSSARKRADLEAERVTAATAPTPQATPAPAPAEPTESLDLQVLSKLLAAIDAKLAQQAAKLDKRVSESEGNSQAALEEIHAALAARVGAVEQNAESIESRVAAFIESAVENRMQTYVDSRVRAMEKQLHRDITDAGDRTAKLLVDTIEKRLLTRIAELEAEVGKQAEAMAEMRAASENTSRQMHDILHGFSQAFHSAAQQLRPSPEPAKLEDGGSGPVPAPEAEPTLESLKLVPRSERRLPIPLVSALAMLIGLAAWTSGLI